MVSKHADDAHQTIDFLCAKLRNNIHSYKLWHRKILLLTSFFWHCTFILSTKTKTDFVAYQILNNCHWLYRYFAGVLQTTIMLIIGIDVIVNVIVVSPKCRHQQSITLCVSIYWRHFGRWFRKRDAIHFFQYL